MPASCTISLVSSYSTCSSVLLATGLGAVNVDLPMPTAIEAILLSNLQLAPPRDAAAQAPVSLPTAAAVQVLVRFSDGTLRDFTTDSRTTITVVAGADMCILEYDGEHVVWASGSRP